MSAPPLDDTLRQREHCTTEALRAITASRAVIEQAKGMLMLVYGIDADVAFEILRGQSQEHNIKLRVIAMQILADLVGLPKSKSPSLPGPSADGLIRTAHKRIAAAEARLERHPR